MASEHSTDGTLCWATGPRRDGCVHGSSLVTARFALLMLAVRKTKQGVDAHLTSGDMEGRSRTAPTRFATCGLPFSSTSSSKSGRVESTVVDLQTLTINIFVAARVCVLLLL
jgi:hypothetical protein